MIARTGTLSTIFVLGCTGNIGLEGTGDSSPGGARPDVECNDRECNGTDVPGSPGESFGGPIPENFVSAIPRLSRRELDNTLDAVFGLPGLAERFLPLDARVVTDESTGAETELFDTQVSTTALYLPAETFVQGSLHLAEEVSLAVATDPGRLEALSGCRADSVGGAGCLRSLIENAGLRLFRRRLTTEEVAAVETLSSTFLEDGLAAAARAALQALLMSPDFLYQPQIVDASGELDDYATLTRLSYLLWGHPPTDQGLADLDTQPLTQGRFERLAQDMVAHPWADEQLRKLHSMWLRYDELLVSDLQLREDLLQESDALVDRTLQEADRAWSELFTSGDSFITPRLAEHYGMNAPTTGDGGWATYENPERAGLLSHGSFLSLSSTDETGTLISRRGAMILQRVLCERVASPPPDVDMDQGVKVEEGACKQDEYRAHSSGVCAGCHERMDGVGFGFERFDGLGAYRTVERENADCSIDGTGNIGGSQFQGIAEFAQQASSSGRLLDCAAEQVFRFAMRRNVGSQDVELLDHVSEEFVAGGEDIRALLVSLATDPRFRRPQTEEVAE